MAENMDKPMPEAEEDSEVVTEETKKAKFLVDRDLIPASKLSDETDDLQGLGLDVFNQDDFEQGVMDQVDKAIAKEEEKKKKESLKKELKKITDDIRSMKHEVAGLVTQLSQLKHASSGGANRRLLSAQKQKETKAKELEALEARKKTVQARIDGKLPLFDEAEKGYGDVLNSTGNKTRDDMIRTGEMTPFGTVVTHVKEEAPEEPMPAVPKTRTKPIKAETSTCEYDLAETPGGSSSKKEGRSSDYHLLSDSDLNDSADEWVPGKHDNSDSDGAYQDKQEKSQKKKIKQKSWSKVYNRPIYRSGSEDEEEGGRRNSVPRAKVIRKHRDDGNEEFYEDRIQEFNDVERFKQKQRYAGQLEESDSDEEFDGGFKVPSRIWKKLYKYQKTCVKWLWELHCQEAGGIIGDEMGLGKTVQAIAFLAGIKYSKLRNKNFSHRGLGPCLIVCPATVMHQWVKEFHTWWPPFKIAIMHASGTFVGKERDLIRSTVRDNGIIVTSYSTLVIQQEHILPYNWHYIVLDEGHKIRNPDAQATLVCKQFRTPHRIILSGSPIQNNLKELWSLMDFVFPGKLGTLPDFTQHFAVPIVQGGYSNATEVQVQTAYKCACVLRDTINPYLLRRMKADVKTAINLPGKNEQVLFCRLTDEQKEVYREYLDSRDCQEILSGRIMIFAGLIQLRKLCNHPDLVTGGPRVFKHDKSDNSLEMEYGFWKRAGKMIVVEALLKLWKKQGHKALLFTQSKQMLDILEQFVQMKGYSYVRMDGGTGISSREPLVQKYNTDDSIYLFLLTTRVGGLGINLVGANRIVIYDPDWNPSTDMQARERAWRIGQKRQVTIYRLLTTGTIEEKIYHRKYSSWRIEIVVGKGGIGLVEQIFKQFLTNRVLKDPKQRRLFKTNDLYELFSLGYSDDKGETETAALFAGTGSDVNVIPRKVNRFDKLKEEKEQEKKKKAEKVEDDYDDQGASLNFDDDKISKMREFAKRLSQKMEAEKILKKDDSGEVVSGSSKDKSHSGKDSDISVKKSKSDMLKNYKIKRKSSSELSEGSDNNVKSKTGPSAMKQSQVPSTSATISEASRSQDKPNSVCDKPQKRSREGDHKDRHKRKKHKRKDAKFEGERIPHLVKMKSFQAAQQDDQNKADEDDYVLQRLFKKTGIQGALKHDKIMDPGHSDYVIVENEAEKVAREASLALKKSRSKCLPATAGTPNWTGQHGGMKRPRFGQKKNTALAGSEKILNKDKDKKSEETHFDGSLAGSVQTDIETGSSISTAVSSTDLLNKMRVRNEVFTKTGDENEDNDDTNVFVSEPSSLDLLKKMRDFIMFDCKDFGQATTQEVLNEFGDKLPHGNSAKFRALLNSICDLVKKDGVGVWKLRGDFK